MLFRPLPARVTITLPREELLKEIKVLSDSLKKNLIRIEALHPKKKLAEFIAFQNKLVRMHLNREIEGIKKNYPDDKEIHNALAILINLYKDLPNKIKIAAKNHGRYQKTVDPSFNVVVLTRGR